MIRNIFLSLAILILISGCSLRQTNPERAAVPDVPEKKEVKTMETNPINPSQFEDLASQYSGAILKTNFGDIKVKFYSNDSPFTVNNFLNLAKAGFYDGTRFHRVIKDFMIQGGDPNSRDDDWSIHGIGGPDYRFKDEINDNKIVKGSLAMANAGPDTNGSQFFIVTAEATSWLDGKHTNFGFVEEGMDVVEKIDGVEVDGRDHPTQDVVINSIELIK